MAYRPLVIIALVALAGACERRLAAPPAAEAPEAAHQDESGEHRRLPTRVRLSDKVIRDAGIKTTAVAQRSLPQTVDLTGEVTADPDRTAYVTAPVPGRVAEVRFKDGDPVAAGAVLVVLESTDLARTRAELRATAARAQAAQRNRQRLEALGQVGLAAGQEVASARAEAEALGAEAAAAGRALALAGGGSGDPAVARLEIRAPTPGVVLSRDAVRGQAVAAGHLLARLTDLQHAYFLGRLFEKNLARVRRGEQAEVRLNAYPDEVFLGTVERIGHQLDPAARTVVARVAIRDHGDLLKVGLFGKVRITTPEASAPAAQLVVPLGAVVRIAEQEAVFVHQPDGHFEVHPVRLGRSADGQVAVISGLRLGEQVVSEGTFTLKSMVLKGSFGEED